MEMELERPFQCYVSLRDSLQQLGLHCDSFLNLCENLAVDLHGRILRLYRPSAIE